MNDAEETTNPAPATATTPLDSAMDTGAENEPALSVGDKHLGDVPDPNGDGVLTVEEAAALLGEPQTETNASNPPASLAIEGK